MFTVHWATFWCLIALSHGILLLLLLLDELFNMLPGICGLLTVCQQPLQVQAMLTLQERRRTSWRDLLSRARESHSYSTCTHLSEMACNHQQIYTTALTKAFRNVLPTSLHVVLNSALGKTSILSVKFSWLATSWSRPGVMDSRNARFTAISLQPVEHLQ